MADTLSPILFVFPICNSRAGSGAFWCRGCSFWIHPKCGGYTKAAVQKAPFLYLKKVFAPNFFRENSSPPFIPKSSPQNDSMYLLYVFLFDLQ
jgi:hypothetical protein